MGFRTAPCRLLFRVILPGASRDDDGACLLACPSRLPQVMQRVTQTIRNLPPHHPEATLAHEAYRLEELIPGAARYGLV